MANEVILMQILLFVHVASSVLMVVVQCTRIWMGKWISPFREGWHGVQQLASYHAYILLLCMMFVAFTLVQGAAEDGKLYSLLLTLTYVVGGSSCLTLNGKITIMKKTKKIYDSLFSLAGVSGCAMLASGLLATRLLFTPSHSSDIAWFLALIAYSCYVMMFFVIVILSAVDAFKSQDTLSIELDAEIAAYTDRPTIF